MSLTYATYVSELETLIPTTSADADFLAILPGTIDFAENKIYRELDLLSAIISDTSGTATANSRAFTLPQTSGYIMVVRGINVLTPAGASVAAATRNPLVRTTRDFVDFAWPSNAAPSASTVPTMWAPVSDQNILFAPPPGSAFKVEVYGTIRPAALSVSNTTTFLTAHLPDLFVAASMIFISGYLKNFGAQADDPKMAASWQSTYDKLLASADAEELRRKFGANFKR